MIILQIKQLFGWLSVNTDLPKKRHRRRRQEVEEDGDDDNDGDDNDDDGGGDDDDDDGDDDGEHGTRLINRRNNSDNVFAMNSITISHSCMQGYKSALVWWYTENGFMLDSSINKWCDDFVNGYKKTIADKKQRGVMPIGEGKAPLSFQGYGSICDHLTTESSTGNFSYEGQPK